MLGVIILSIVGLLTLIYLWLFYNFNYWQRKGVPQHPWTFWVKCAIDVLLMRSSFPRVYNQMYISYPDHDVVGVYGIYRPKLLIRSPALIKKIMVSDFSSFHDNEFYVSPKIDPYFALDPFCLRGDEWKPYRTRLTYYLTGGKVKELFPLMKDILPKLDTYIDSLLGTEIDPKDLVSLFFMDNISNNVLGVDSNCFADADSDFRKMADLQMKDALQTWWKVMIMTNLPKLRDLIGLRFVPKSVSDYLESLLKEVLRYRKENNVSRNDLFQHIIKREQSSSNENLTELFFVGVTFFLEGFESSSMTASPILFELALNPDVQEKLHQELVDTIGDKFDPDFDTINNLPYLQQIFQESGRKYPTMYEFRRLCTKPSTLEVNGESLPVQPGIVCLIPLMSIQRDPQYYPDPEQFNPDRFSEQGANITPYTHLPFGEGPRTCPGIKFGQAQVKLLVAHIVYKYRILPTPKTPSKVTFSDQSFMAFPAVTMWISLQRRK